MFGGEKMPPRAYVFLTAFLRCNLKYARPSLRKREINENHILEDQSLIDYYFTTALLQSTSQGESRSNNNSLDDEYLSVGVVWYILRDCGN